MAFNAFKGCAFAAVFLSMNAWGQAPPFDTVRVDLPANVKINGQTLPAGRYEIRQVQSFGGAARVLFIASNGGTKLEVAGATIPILNNETPGETKVIVQHIGDIYYLDKIWINGKDYGYQFPLPPEAVAAMRERGQPMTLSANYTPPAATVAKAAPPPAPAAPPPPPAPVAAAPPPPPAPPVQQAQAAPPPPEPLPSTASNSALFALVGIALSGLGIALKQRRTGNG